MFKRKTITVLVTAFIVISNIQTIYGLEKGIIKQCDYLVLLSDTETWGLVITEAKILGVPCIVTDFEAAYEQIKDNENGLILSREDTTSYDNKIDLILNNKHKYKEKLSKFKWSNDDILKDWTNILNQGGI